MNTENALNELERKRYARHFLLPGFGPEQQVRIKNASAVIIGVGGLGNTAAQQLSLAGIGRITLVDFDTVETSNLARQVLFDENAVGLNKATTAAETLRKHYPGTQYEVREELFDDTNGRSICEGHSILMDCTDLPSVKYQIDRVARALQLPLIFGAVNRFDGQVAIFHGRAQQSYLNLFGPNSIGPESDTCDTLGVWSPAVNIVGSIMAQEALNLLAFGTSELDGKLLQMDLKHYSFHTFQLSEGRETTRAHHQKLPSAVQPIHRSEVQARQAHDMRTLTIALSKSSEMEFAHIDLQLSMDELVWESNTWEKERPLILTCNKGIQSMEAALLLSELGFHCIHPVLPD
jgi:adenylyltransferase/sulfurtransferase